MKKRELLALIDALNVRVAQLEQQVAYQQLWVTPIATSATSAPTTTPTDCGCPTSNYICNNYICPRAPRVTNDVTVRGEAGTLVNEMVNFDPAVFISLRPASGPGTDGPLDGQPRSE